MKVDIWKEFTTDLSLYSDVYVRVFYSGSTQPRYIDDLTLTLKDFTVGISKACTDGSRFYGTFSADFSFKVPADVTVSEIGVTGDKLVVTHYAAGDVIPANTGVMISSATAGDKTFTWATGGSALSGGANRLRPTLSGIGAEAMGNGDEDFLYYRLTMHDGVAIGFWWGADEGAAFAMDANKAYLAVPKASASRGFSLIGVNAAGVDDKALLEKPSSSYYNLQGLPADSPKKGLYIVNGKKMLVK